MAPAIGCPAPHSNICKARPRENTSRPQPCATDTGVRNSPSVERGPKPSADTAAPQTRITAGVRQVINFEVARTVMKNSGGSAVARDALRASLLFQRNADKFLFRMDLFSRGDRSVPQDAPPRGHG